MRTLILLAATAALGACSQAAEESDDTAPLETAAATTEAAATPTASMAGTYEFEVDGKKTTSVLMADGTYSDSQDGNVTESGTWTERDGKTCFDPKGDDTPETCFVTTEPDAGGVFTATPDGGGDALTITRIG